MSKTIECNQNNFNSLGYVDVGSFKSKNCLVDRNGKKINYDYDGEQYRLIGKKLHPFSLPMRISRIAFGLLAAIAYTVTLGQLSSIKTINKLIFKKGIGSSYHAVLFAKNFKDAYENAKNELQEGTKLSEEEKNNVYGLFKVPQDPDVYKKISENVQTATKVYEISPPNLPARIYKLTSQKQLEARYENMIKGQMVKRAYQLDRLVIPHAVMFNFKIPHQLKSKILVEQKLDISTAKSFHFEDETARQLALFVCKTGYWDAEYRNNPEIIGRTKNNQQLALVDLEKMDSPVSGIYGYFSAGLYNLFNSRQKKMLLAMAEKEGIKPLSGFSH